MSRLSLSQRLSLVFALLLAACTAAAAWLQIGASRLREEEAVQRLSAGLAQHIADSAPLMDAEGLRRDAVRQLFDKLMAVNPSVEVYLLSADGRIVADAAPPGHVKRDRVDLHPVRRLLAGQPLPIFGDDPRSETGRKVFSAAPLVVEGREQGYVYVVLQGERRDAVAAPLAASSVVRTTLLSLGLVALCCLIAGLVAFGLITRPLRRLTAAVRGFDGNEAAATAALQAAPPHAVAGAGGDEIVVLEQAFRQMAARIAEQWRELNRQDQQRRELLANISHDLRTPLTSLHGYLETLLMKADKLDAAERRRYLEVALAQSRKVGGLAQSLFDLARLESGLIQPDRETFVLPDLVQDVFQKFELAAQARGIRLNARFERNLPAVEADVGMTERVLTNLLDNAIRHSPSGGCVDVCMTPADGAVQVSVSDDGPGIPEPLRAGLFERVSPWRAGGEQAGGFGLLTVHRMLALHGCTIRLAPGRARGAVFEFSLPAAACVSTTLEAGPVHR
ncbi:two-component sensor histidine kinase [Bordetella genomosp. 9]|uniref:sensor histidine kinase n=1 Tax=Bordetella genomosp. 9 TaxID=1416803 RepID=UPI000A290FA3|nr:HAMP domain-containing sensor histidine kinase [Bordetella genomosp. 9]ARP91414.1 two-component sensor histidine kinase [Bordetella genomosp. 9]